MRKHPLFGYAAALALLCSANWAAAQTASRYGPNDRLGAVNNVKPEMVVRAELAIDRALAADRAYEFLFIMGAPRLTGTVQANIHPIAVR